MTGTNETYETLVRNLRNTILKQQLMESQGRQARIGRNDCSLETYSPHWRLNIQIGGPAFIFTKEPTKHTRY